MQSRYAVGLALATILGAGWAEGSTVHFSNGTRIYSSSNGGSSWAQTDGAVTFMNGETGGGIVGLGYHSNSQTFYATTANGKLWSVAGLGTSNVELTVVNINLGGSTISFDFFGDEFRGMRGGQLITIPNITSPTDPTVLNGSTGLSNVPSTGNVSGTYYGIQTGTTPTFNRINSAGAATLIGAVSALAGMDVAGGASVDGVYYTTAGFNTTTSDYAVFGSVDLVTGAFSQIGGNIDFASFGDTLQGSMGMVMVVPLPPAAWAGIGSLACVAGFGVIRRRRLAAN